MFLISHSCIGTSTGCTSTSNTMSQTPPSYPPCFPGMDHPGHPAVPCYDTKFAYRTSALHHWDRCCIKDGEEKCECAVHSFITSQSQCIRPSWAFELLRREVAIENVGDSKTLSTYTTDDNFDIRPFVLWCSFNCDSYMVASRLW